VIQRDHLMRVTLLDGTKHLQDYLDVVAHRSSFACPWSTPILD
jgi:hypothetical protein